MQAELGHAVISLTKVAINSCCRRSKNQAAVLGFPHMRPGCMTDFKCTFNVYLVHQIPVVFSHFGKTFIAQYTCVVNDYINAAKIIHRGLDDFIAVGNSVVIGYGFASGGNYFFDYSISGIFSGTVTGSTAAQVICHDFGATSC
jgi:hypothetical protein